MNFLTEQKLKKILIGNKEIHEWYKSLITILPTYKINTIERVAAFLAQTAHESNSYSVLKENLNYSADGLLKVFPKYFNSTTAAAYARNPEKIANKIYANRIGNGPESSGDGWRFFGRGIIQLTGKSNYSSYSKKVFNDDRLIQNPDLILQSKETMLKIACEFWVVNGLNVLADLKDTVAITKKINGGTLGIDDRKLRFENALKILAN